MKKLSEYFSGVAYKILSEVEANPATSNQHEFNGLAIFKEFLGEAKLSLETSFVWFGHDESENFGLQSTLTWYDSRERNPKRSAEYRLYYKSNEVMDRAAAGDLLVIAKLKNSDKALAIIIQAGSPFEDEIRWVFGVTSIGTKPAVIDLSKIADKELNFTLRNSLRDLGVELEEPPHERFLKLVDSFGKTPVLPPTAVFSRLIRDAIGKDMDAIEDPDAALIMMIDWELRLFEHIERFGITERLQQGFVLDNGHVDVEGFLSFSLSVQNKRKSRAGAALEHHLGWIFQQNQIRFSAGAITENRNKPDFLFPGIDAYQDAAFPTANLTMLGSKATCKDRWRQVLAEAERIQDKHLFTLERAISENQTTQMQQSRLQLVVPTEIQMTYNARQQNWLLSLKDFVGMVASRDIVV
jgi:EcoRII C terminal